MQTLGFVITGFVFLSIICVFAIRHYVGPLVKKDVIISVYLSWVLGFAGILLLPYDISVAIVESPSGKDYNNSDLLDVWRFVYWSTFILAWLILPIQMEYHNSGHFTFLEKLYDAFRQNFIMGCLAAVAGIVYIIYMIITSGGSLSEVIGFMMAISNTYGVILLIFLMGNGLAALPRRMWQLGDDLDELRRLYISVNSIESSYQQARYELEDCEEEVKEAIKFIQEAETLSQVGHNIITYIGHLQEKTNNFVFHGTRSTSRQHLVTKKLNTVPAGYNQPTTKQAWTDKNTLVKLHKRLIQAQTNALSASLRWRSVIDNIVLLERYISVSTGVEPSIPVPPSNISTTDTVNSNISNNNRSIYNWLLSTIKYIFPRFHFQQVQQDTNEPQVTSLQSLSSIQIFIMKYKKIFYSFFALACGMLSFIILWQELVLSTSLHSPIGILISAYSTTTNTTSTNTPSSSFIQLISFITLAYMSFCTFWCLFRLNLGWAYALQPRQSTASALIFNGQYLSRLQFPLGYNFLLTINASILDQTAFKLLMSNLEVIPIFGTSFIVFVPLLMILVALATFFNISSRMLHMLGIETEDRVGGPILCCKRKTNTNGTHISNNNGNSSILMTLEGELSGEDLDKFENGRMLIKNELRQMNLVSLIKQPTNTSSNVSGTSGLDRFYNKNQTSSSSSNSSSGSLHSVDSKTKLNYGNNKKSSFLYEIEKEEDLDRRIDDDDDDDNSFNFNNSKHNKHNQKIQQSINNSTSTTTTTTSSTSLFSNFSSILSSNKNNIYQPVVENINDNTRNTKSKSNIVINPILQGGINNTTTAKASSSFIINHDENDDDDSFGGGRYA